ncbi:MAG TPA: hypothetical protein VFG28_08185, partial [Syntrophales bacterium]|nr:hypothetical protein [Syntrophales bacterium]
AQKSPHAVGEGVDEFFEMYSLLFHVDSDAVAGLQAQFPAEKSGFTFYLMHYIQLGQWNLKRF